MGGVIVATINILLLAVGGDPVDAAFYCFLFSVVFLLGSVLALLHLKRTPLYRQCVRTSPAAQPEPGETTQLLGAEGEGGAKTVSVAAVLAKIRTEAATVFIIYLVTLGLFPAVTVLVESEGAAEGGVWASKYFVPVACFLLYNLGDYLGRLVAGSGLHPRLSSRAALLLACVRAGLVPLLLVCNIAPGQRHLLPVLLPSDAAFVCVVAVLALSNGHLTTVVMVAAPARVLAHEQQTASNLMVGLLGLGLISGAVLSAGLVKIL